MKFKHYEIDEHGNQVARGDGQLYANAIQLGDRLIRMDLGPRDVHLDAALASFCTGFRQKGFVADEVALTVPVDHLSDKYWQWNKDDTFEEADLINNAPEGDVAEISPRPSNDSYLCKLYAISTFVRSEVVSNADSALKPRMAAAKRCMSAMLLANEVRKQAPLQNVANFDANLVKTMTGATAWLDLTTGLPGASSDPIKDVQDILEASLMPVTKMVMNRTVLHAMSRHPKVQSYFQAKDGTPQIPTPDQLSRLFELPPIVVADAKRKVGSGYPYIWGNDVTLIHKPDGLPTGEDIVNLANFRWTGQGSPLSGSVAIDNGFMVRSYFDEKRGVLGGEKIIFFVFEDEKVVTTSVGGLLKGVVGTY